MHRTLSRTVALALAVVLGAVPLPSLAVGEQRLPPSPAPSGAATSAPDTALTTIELARRQGSTGDVAGAIATLQPFVAAYPGELEAARLLGDLYARSGDRAAAEATYRAILVHHPGDKDTHNRLGGIYAAQDRIGDALAEFQASLPSAAGYAGIVAEHRRLGDLAGYERQLSAEAAMRPGDLAVQSLYGNVLRLERKYDLAVIPLTRALHLREDCMTESDLANLYLDQSDTRRALPLLTTCLTWDPNDYAGLVNTGEAYVQLASYDVARPFFERAAHNVPGRGEAFVDLGYLDDLDGNWKAAIAYYERAIGADPNVREAYIDLGYDYTEHEYFALAEATFLKGLSAAPSDGRLHYMLGLAYAEQGKVALARDQYQTATESDEAIVAGAAREELDMLTAPR